MSDDKVMNLPRDEIAVRKVYQPLVEAGTLTTVFRPGNRVCKDGENVVRCYWKGEEITMKIIEVLGSDVYKIAPKFSESVNRMVRIEDIRKMEFVDLQDSDFEGSSPDVRTPEQLAYHLGLIYGKTVEEVKADGVTRIVLKYLD